MDILLLIDSPRPKTAFFYIFRWKTCSHGTYKSVVEMYLKVVEMYLIVEQVTHLPHYFTYPGIATRQTGPKALQFSSERHIFNMPGVKVGKL